MKSFAQFIEEDISLDEGDFNTRNIFKPSDPDKAKKTVGSPCLKCGKGKYSSAFDSSWNAMCPKCGDTGASLKG